VLCTPPIALVVVAADALTAADIIVLIIVSSAQVKVVALVWVKGHGVAISVSAAGVLR
jgi:hypothetical protein